MTSLSPNYKSQYQLKPSFYYPNQESYQQLAQYQATSEYTRSYNEQGYKKYGQP